MLNFYFQGSRPTLLHSVDNFPILLLTVRNQSGQKKGSLCFQAVGGKCLGNLFLALFQRKTLVTGHETQWGEDGNGNNNDNEKREGKATRINYGNI